MPLEQCEMAILRPQPYLEVIGHQPARWMAKAVVSDVAEVGPLLEEKFQICHEVCRHASQLLLCKDRNFNEKMPPFANITSTRRICVHMIG